MKPNDALFSIDIDQNAVFYMIDADHCLFLPGQQLTLVDPIDIHFTALFMTW